MGSDEAYELAATGQRLIVRASSAESLVYESFLPAQQAGFVLDAGARQEQRFEVLEGTLSFCVDGAVTLLTPGGRLTVPRGMSCSYWNPGSAPSHLVAEVRPALDFEALIVRSAGRACPA
jgi:mannose-6-phosphate isomerase-like protein (cupin superfamily)